MGAPVVDLTGGPSPFLRVAPEDKVPSFIDVDGTLEGMVLQG